MTRQPERGSGRGFSSLVVGRFRLTLVLLAVPLVATMVIGGAYLRSQLQYRAAVETASSEIARAMLRDASDQMLTRATLGARRVMEGAFNPAGYTGEDTAAAGLRLAGMQAVVDTAGHAVTLPVRDLMVYDPTTDALEVSGRTTSGGRWLARAEATGILETDPDTGLLSVAAEDDAGPYLTFFAWLRRQGRPPILLGVDVDLDRMAEVLIEPSIRMVTRAHLGEPDPEVPLGVRVAHPDGFVVHRDGQPGVGPTHRVDLFGGRAPSAGDPGSRPFAASLSIPPAVLPELIPGGLPGSPWPLVLATVGVAILLTGLAALLLWRVRELILLRERFVSSVSHELRTPLTQMLAYAETLQLERPTPNARRRAADVVVRETRRLIQLVENALDFVRGERSSTAFEPTPLDLEETVSGVVEELEDMARAARSTLEMGPSEPAYTRADPAMLHRVILNLVHNALTHGPRGQTVEVAVRRRGPWSEILVDDEGPGVQEADRDRVWRAFERLHPDASGTGLGLTIVRQLVELHGGQVEIRDAPGGGARFLVRLPADTSAYPGAPDSPEPDVAPDDRAEAAWHAS